MGDINLLSIEDSLQCRLVARNGLRGDRGTTAVSASRVSQADFWTVSRRFVPVTQLPVCPSERSRWRGGRCRVGDVGSPWFSTQI